MPLKRVFAYLIDALLIAILSSVLTGLIFVPIIMTFGMLEFLFITLLALIPLLYHTTLIGGARAATLGMQLLGIETRTLAGAKPTYSLALILTIVFYVTIGLTSWLILIVTILNARSRTFHDILCGTIVINTDPDRPT